MGFFLGGEVVGFELRDSQLLGRLCTAWVTPLGSNLDYLYFGHFSILFWFILTLYTTFIHPLASALHWVTACLWPCFFTPAPSNRPTFHNWPICEPRILSASYLVDLYQLLTTSTPEIRQSSRALGENDQASQWQGEPAPLKGSPHHIPANNTDVFPCTPDGNRERLEFSRNLPSC
jgi:hypothetical protein